MHQFPQNGHFGALKIIYTNFIFQALNKLQLMKIPSFNYYKKQFEGMAAWSQILQTVGNSMLVYISFEIYDIHIHM